MVHCLMSNWEAAEIKYGVDSEQHLDAICEPLAWCMKEDGHDGPCEFVPIDQITIKPGPSD